MSRARASGSWAEGSRSTEHGAGACGSLWARGDQGGARLPRPGSPCGAGGGGAQAAARVRSDLLPAVRRDPGAPRGGRPWRPLLPGPGKGARRRPPRPQLRLPLSAPFPAVTQTAQRRLPRAAPRRPLPSGWAAHTTPRRDTGRSTDKEGREPRGRPGRGHRGNRERPRAKQSYCRNRCARSEIPPNSKQHRNGLIAEKSKQNRAAPQTEVSVQSRRRPTRKRASG